MARLPTLGRMDGIVLVLSLQGFLIKSKVVNHDAHDLWGRERD